jgi:AAA family ATP:ADP antiporter
VTPAHLLVSYHGSNEKSEEKEQEPGFLEGFWLLVSHKYLLAIFMVVAFPEIIATVFDFHFNALASQHFSGVELSAYLLRYASWVNLLALGFLLCGAGRITTILGLGMSLLLMPVIYALSVLGFVSLDSLTFLFYLMASSKAINYALNGPAIKQLYIPTTHDVRFKSQAWIETFGSRGAKELGSFINMGLTPLKSSLGKAAGLVWHARIASFIFIPLLVAWAFIAIFLGKKHRTAIAEKKVVC